MSALRVRTFLPAVAALAGLLAWVPAAHAMPSEFPDPSWGTSGHVAAIVQVGGLVVVGGHFAAISENGGAGPQSLPRTNIAAFDASTGAPAAGWVPQLNGDVHAIAVSADRARVYVGGAFTTVDGVARYRIAALDAATGALVKSFKPPSAFATVRALAATSDRLYVGGLFQALGGQPRLRLGALDPVTGALDPAWAPSADAAVRSLAVSPDGARVYAAGDFTTVSGQAQGGVVALDAAGAGAVVEWHPDALGSPVLAVATAGDSVFGGGGGSENTLFSWDAASGSERWQRKADGDFQALAVAGSMLYAGGHFSFYEGEARTKLVAMDAATGQLRRSWTPVFPHDDATWGGVWALSADGGQRLAVGGDFTTVSGVTQQRYAQFTGSIDGATGDTDPPTVPGALTATAIGGSRVELAWTASTDDDAVARYDVFRDGQLIATTGTAGWSDRSVEPSTSYAYRVVAVDFAGHVSEASAEATAATAPPDEVRSFTAVEDAQLDFDTPDKVAGANTTLKTDAGPRRDFLVKFDLSGVAGRRVVSAKLRMVCTDASTNGGEFTRVSNGWEEHTVSWNTAPAGDGTVADAINDVAIGGTAEADVTPLVTGDGALSLRVRTPSTNQVAYYSSEGATPPVLVVKLADSSVAVPHESVFADGFETGDLSRWTEKSGLAASPTDPVAGGWAVHAMPNGQPGYALKRMRRSEPELYTRLRFKLRSSSADSVALLRYRTGTGTALARLFVTSAGKLGVRNDVTGQSATSIAGVGSGWHTAQLRALVNGADSRLQLWLDGRLVDEVGRSDSLGTVPIGRLQLGDDAAGKLYDLSFDDLVADAERVRDVLPPSAPGGVSATAESPHRVRIAWQAATDDTGVSGYVISRDGTELATLGPVTQFTDDTVAPSTGYAYEVRALDADGNVSGSGEPASVTTPDLDTTPPTTPVAAATAISFDRVDVSWSASADDVGVTGYRVYRDGALVATVAGSTTRFPDGDVQPATVYSYAVEAFDDGGNTSARSDAVTATAYERTTFRDGFESGDLSQWTTVRGLSAQAGDGFAGTWTARATPGGQPAYAYRQLAAGLADVTYRMRFKLVSLGGGSVSLLKLRTGTGTSLVRLFLGTTGKLALRNDVTAVTATGPTTVLPGRWYAAEVRVVVAGTASTVEVRLDGTRIAALSSTQSLGTTPVGRVQLGDDATGKTSDIAYDEVVVDAPPAGGTATVSGTAAPGETLTADHGTWLGTEPMSYAYRWQRCDATGASCTDIEGATADTYTVGAGDEGATIRVSVTATNSAGAATSTSEPTQPVAEP